MDTGGGGVIAYPINPTTVIRLSVSALRTEGHMTLGGELEAAGAALTAAEDREEGWRSSTAALRMTISLQSLQYAELKAREASLREALEAVRRRSATSASRTLGEASDELAMCQDIARAALATGEQP
jgi:hypothetical protein